MKNLFSKIKNLFINKCNKKSIWTVLISITVLLFLIAPNNSLGDWRKGSDATLQATISLDKEAFAKSNLNDSIHVYKSSDYEQCIKNVVINPTWCTPNHEVIATCNTTSNGMCWCGMNSNFELKFTTSDGTSVGYVKFHEAYGTHFEVKEIKSYNGYLISVRTEIVHRDANFEVKISVN